MEELIKELSDNDILNNFKNKHRTSYITLLIDIKNWSKMDKNDIAIEQQIQQPNGQVMLRKIKVKEALPPAEAKRDSEKQLLQSIEDVRLNLSNKN